MKSHATDRAGELLPALMDAAAADDAVELLDPAGRPAVLHICQRGTDARESLQPRSVERAA